jgi:nucleotide-binding universal stress UspA family protein
MSSEFYSKAISDFQRARSRAELLNFLAKLTGRSTDLLSYEEVRQKLRAIEGSTHKLEDIPINAIIGSVGRYTDFNKDFLPQQESNRERWVRVMLEATGQRGLPPIEVYRIGEIYFVLDGNHRVSVAKELGATHIQAYVTDVKTRIKITPELNPDELIIKSEQVRFLEKTNLNVLRPESDLTLTTPGRYPVLLEHIAVHQYFMGIDENRQISYNEAVLHWYDNVYLPVVDLIRERGILNMFPIRTEADLYIWLAKHREDLIHELGWEFDTEILADDLIEKYSQCFLQSVSRVTEWILDAATPDGLESGPRTGIWREKQLAHRDNIHLFRNILVGISKDDNDWQALRQAIRIAKKENAVLRGLHVVRHEYQVDCAETNSIVTKYQQICEEANIKGEIAVEVGTAARKICERAHWADLVIGKLTHPPVDEILGRLSSGFRIMVRRCSRPILAVPSNATRFKKALLAYNGSPKADEALYIAAYLASSWKIPLVVLTVQNNEIDAQKVQSKAKDYLASATAPVEFLLESGDIVDSIIQTAQNQSCDFILIGGYKANPMIEIVTGSQVDQILRKTSIPTLICR